MPKPPPLPIPHQPRDAALLGFVLSAISATLSVICFVAMKTAAEALESLPPGARSGGWAFSANWSFIPWQVSAFGMGFFAVVCLGATWLWKPVTLRSWYSVAGLLCLVPVLWLFAACLDLAPVPH